MAEDTISLSPRETAMRMLLHVDDEASYDDIISRLRILQQIDRTMDDAAAAGDSWLEEVIPESSPEPFPPHSAAGPMPVSRMSHTKGRAASDSWKDDPFRMHGGGFQTSGSFGMERANYSPHPPGLPSLVLRSRPLYSWRTLADQSDERSDSVLAGAAWMY